MKGKGGRVYRNSNRTKGSRNVKREDGRSLKLANAEEYKEGAKVSRTHQLLQTIH